MPRLTLLAVMVLTALLVLSAPPRRAGPRPDLTSAAVSDEVIVRLQPAFTSMSDTALATRLGGELLKRIPELDSVLLRLPPGETPAEAVGRLQKLHEVAFAEPNHVLKSTYAPNDPIFSAQTSYYNLIDAQAGWDIELGSASVLVAVLDSGIDITHPDLQGKVWNNPLEIDGNGVDDDGDGCVDDVHGCSFVSLSTSDPSCIRPSSGLVVDDNGHGTFVSGIIAATGNNAIGVIGAAPGVTILPVKILDCTGGGTAADAAQAILYAAKVGARVANISFGADGESNTLANAIKEATNKYGMVVVAATGNDGEKGVTFPARLPETISVGSSGNGADTDVRSTFSDWGPEVTLVAPGANIVSTVPLDRCGQGWNCIQSGQPYAISSGTSFAAPIVSGLAALLISHSPNLPPDAVRRIITSTATRLPEGATPGWAGAGRIRFGEALKQQRYSLGTGGIAKQ